MDAARGGANPINGILFANLASAENTSDMMDYVNGGTKIRNSGSVYLNSAATFLNMTIGIPTIDVDGRIIAGR